MFPYPKETSGSFPGSIGYRCIAGYWGMTGLGSKLPLQLIYDSFVALTHFHVATDVMCLTLHYALAHRIAARQLQKSLQ